MSAPTQFPQRPLCLVVVEGALTLPSSGRESPDSGWIDVDVPTLKEACEIASANDGALVIASWQAPVPPEIRQALRSVRFAAVVEAGDAISAGQARETGALRVIETGRSPELLALQLDELVGAVRNADELQRSRTQIEMLQARSAGGFWEVAPSSGSVWCSPAAAELLTSGEATAGEPLDVWLRRFPSESRARFEAWIGLLLDGGVAPSFEHTLIDGHGVPHRVRHTGRAALDAQGRCHRLTTLVEEVVAHSSNGDLRATGFRGSPDSRLFLHLVERAIREAGRADRHVAVLHIDVHRIRAMTANALSKDAAELLLASVAARVREGVRSGDPIEVAADAGANPVIARWAGEHLTVLLPSLAELADAAKVATRVLELLARPISFAGREICVPASIGIAGFPEDHHSAEELVRRAETASACAREAGSSALRFYDASLDAAALERLTLETALLRAAERNEFSLQYQPRIATDTGEIVAFEALLRWKHPNLGFVPPSQFIPIAEESGLIVTIGKWVLEEACRQNRLWQDAGLAPVKMAVNLSSVQFVHPAILEQVQKTLEHTGLDARWLELELTESTAMHDAGRAVEVLRKLKDLGLEISIDDFGTGYSSLAYLKRFPIDALKIDRSFIAECPGNPEDAAIVTSIVSMARSLGLEVVAEGVENERQLEFLRELGCQEVQGFLFSPAVSAPQAEAMLAGGLRRQSQAA